MKYDLAIMGLGYVGLPLACEAVASGLAVLGVDRDKGVVDALNNGESHVDDISPSRLRSALQNGLAVDMSTNAPLADAEAIVVCVPTPLQAHLPDLSMVEGAMRTVGENLRPGQLVVLESTTYPGTTEEIVKPILEETSGLRAGRDFALAYSPERVDPGNETWTLRTTPRLVAGIDEESSARAEALYRKVCDDVVVLSGTREAELAKLLENTYRHVNIALMNEMAVFSHDMGIDIWESIRGASTKPFGFHAFRPGAGVGGHCIPIDPNYLSHKVRELGYQFRFVELAQEVNARMPSYVVERASRLLNDVGRPVKGSKVLLVGVSYKANVSDTRESPAYDVAGRLLALGAELSYVDPLVASFEANGVDVKRSNDPLGDASTADLVVILTASDALDLVGIADNADLVLDTCAAVPADKAFRL